MQNNHASETNTINQTETT